MHFGKKYWLPSLLRTYDDVFMARDVIDDADGDSVSRFPRDQNWGGIRESERNIKESNSRHRASLEKQRFSHNVPPGRIYSSLGGERVR